MPDVSGSPCVFLSLTWNFFWALWFLSVGNGIVFLFDIVYSTLFHWKIVLIAIYLIDIKLPPAVCAGFFCLLTFPTDLTFFPCKCELPTEQGQISIHWFSRGPSNWVCLQRVALHTSGCLPVLRPCFLLDFIALLPLLCSSLLPIPSSAPLHHCHSSAF